MFMLRSLENGAPISRFVDRSKSQNLRDLAQAMSDHMDRTDATRTGGGYDPNEPRVPTGSGRESDEWTKDGPGAGETQVASSENIVQQEIDAHHDEIMATLKELTNGALSPDLRDKAQNQFNQAIQRGIVACPQCK
jgi:hypothetical protein